MLVNILWPFVPAAILLFYLRRESTLIVFAINYIAMLPAANLLGFAGQELARKLPKVFGILLEITFGSVVEIVLFMVLIKKDHGEGHYVPVIKAAILGSILTNLLLCLGLCFFVGGFKRHEQEFHEAVSEVGSGLLLVAGFALLIPSAFFSALQSSAYRAGDAIPKDAEGNSQEVFTMARLLHDTLAISRGTAIILLVAFVLSVHFPFSPATSKLVFSLVALLLTRPQVHLVQREKPRQHLRRGPCRRRREGCRPQPGSCQGQAHLYRMHHCSRALCYPRLPDCCFLGGGD